ncbi:unnamed protein product [Cochlearia groenlandica]
MMGRLRFRIGGSYSTDCLIFVSEPLAYSVEVSALVSGELTISNKNQICDRSKKEKWSPEQAYSDLTGNFEDRRTSDLLDDSRCSGIPTDDGDLIRRWLVTRWS